MPTNSLLSLQYNDSQDTIDTTNEEPPPQSPSWEFEEIFNLESAPGQVTGNGTGTVSPSQLVADIATDVGVVSQSATFSGYNPSYDSMEPWSPSSWDPLPPSPRRGSFFASQNMLQIPVNSPMAMYNASIGHCASFSPPMASPYRMGHLHSPAVNTQALLSPLFPQQSSFSLYSRAQPETWSLSSPMTTDAYPPSMAHVRPFSELELSGGVYSAAMDVYQTAKSEEALDYHGVGTMPNVHSSPYIDMGSDSVAEIAPQMTQGASPGNHRDLGVPQGHFSRRRASVSTQRELSMPPLSPEFRHSDRIFPASAPAASILSKLDRFSPMSSPRIQSLSSSPTITCASPSLFVNQTAQYSTSRSDEFSHNSVYDVSKDVKPARKRKREDQDDYHDEDSPEKRFNDLPTKSELKPPKQAPSMWQIYFADWLQQHKTRFPHDKLNVAQAAKEAGALYKTLGPTEKEELKRRVQIEKDSRERKLQAWQRTLTPDDIKRENRFRAAQRKAGLSRRANIKDPNAPKKPLSAYFMFLAKIRSEPELVKEVFGDETETTRQSVLAARRWREMSDEEKRPFLTQAEHDKIYYESARKIYEDRTNSISGTGYIIPPQVFPSSDITTSILSARPMKEQDTFKIVAYTPRSPPLSSKAKSAPMAIPNSSTATIGRRRGAKKLAVNAVHSYNGDMESDSSESDDEWVPGRSV